MNNKTSSWICLFLFGSLALLSLNVALGQEQATRGSAAKAPEFSPEVPALYAAALAKVNEDPEYVKAVEAVRKAQLAADKMLFEKLRKVEPRIQKYADYLEQVRNPKPRPEGPASE
jgi:hypothetical protein